MYTIDQTQAMLEELSEQIPDVFFTKLNGGICLLEEEKLHDESKPGCPLYIMGEYHHNRQMGSYINIYYGSFIKVHGGLSESGFKEKLFETLRHEFQHHIERLAGDRTLEIDDKVRLMRYRGELPRDQSIN